MKTIASPLIRKFEKDIYIPLQSKLWVDKLRGFNALASLIQKTQNVSDQSLILGMIQQADCHLLTFLFANNSTVAFQARRILVNLLIYFEKDLVT